MVERRDRTYIIHTIVTLYIVCVLCSYNSKLLLLMFGFTVIIEVVLNKKKENISNIIKVIRVINPYTLLLELYSSRSRVLKSNINWNFIKKVCKVRNIRIAYCFTSIVVFLPLLIMIIICLNLLIT